MPHEPRDRDHERGVAVQDGYCGAGSRHEPLAISDPAYDFVRSIHVLQIEYWRHRNRDGDCNTWSTIRVGTYGEQGDFAWARSTPARVPSASAFRPGTSCSDYWFRGVFVDWTDYEGTYGFEEVRY